MMRRTSETVAALAVGAAALGTSLFLTPSLALAQAQAAPAASTPGFSSNAPVDITADTLNVFRDQHMTVWKGNVEVIQGQARLRTPELQVFSQPSGKAAENTGAAAPGQDFGHIDRMEAAGPVYYVTPTQVAKGDHGAYEKTSDTITLTGNVIVTQDKNVISGDKLIIEQKSGHSTLISNSPGRSQPKRVRGVFYPNQAPAAGQPKPAPTRSGKPAR